MRLTIVGTGYVGLVTGTCFADTGNDVTCLDVDPQKIARLQQGESPIYEPGLEEIILRNVKAARLRFTTDKARAYARAELIFICVGTPSDNGGNADLRYVLDAARDIGDALEARGRAAASPEPGGVSSSRPVVVVVKSTVPVGSNARVREAIAARTSQPFLMASNPEFLKEGAAVQDFYKPDRVVVGCDDERSGELMRDLYDPFVRQGNPIFVMDIPSAEMVKYASNAMLATKISFINEIANLCEAYGAEIEAVRRGMTADKRIGNQFLYPGLGYGGSCFPKDVLACVAMGEEAKTEVSLLRAVHEVNQRQRQIFTQKIERQFGGELAGRRVAVWGISFKPQTDDVREAPALTVISWLLERGVEVVAFDPVAMEAARGVFGDRIRYAAREFDALDGADALVLCTEWSEFRHPDFAEMKRRMRGPLIFDGRNLYRPETMEQLGFTYVSVGRRMSGA